MIGNSKWKHQVKVHRVHLTLKSHSVKQSPPQVSKYYLLFNNNNNILIKKVVASLVFYLYFISQYKAP